MDNRGRIFSEVGDDIDPSKSTYVSQQQIAQQIVNNSLRQITSNPKDNRAVEALTGTSPNKFRQTADKLKQLAGGAIETIGNNFNDLSPKPKEQASTETQTPTTGGNAKPTSAGPANKPTQPNTNNPTDTGIGKARNVWLIPDKETAAILSKCIETFEYFLVRKNHSEGGVVSLDSDITITTAINKAKEITDPFAIASHVFYKDILPKIENPMNAFGDDVEQAKNWFGDIANRFKFGDPEVWESSESVEEISGLAESMRSKYTETGYGYGTMIRAIARGITQKDNAKNWNPVVGGDGSIISPQDSEMQNLPFESPRADNIERRLNDVARQEFEGGGENLSGSPRFKNEMETLIPPTSGYGGYGKGAGRVEGKEKPSGGEKPTGLQREPKPKKRKLLPTDYFTNSFDNKSDRPAPKPKRTKPET